MFNYILLVQLLPIRLICHTPIVIRDLDVTLSPFSAVNDEKTRKKMAFFCLIAYYRPQYSPDGGV
jgi:hypothetical protein